MHRYLYGTGLNEAIGIKPPMFYIKVGTRQYTDEVIYKFKPLTWILTNQYEVKF